MILSNTLPTVGMMLIGLKLLGSSCEPLLCRGLTLVFFHAIANLRDARLRLYIDNRIGLIAVFPLFNMKLVIPSMMQDLLPLKRSIADSTSSSNIV